MCCVFKSSCQRSLLTTKAFPGPEVIKLFSCSTQLNTKFIVLINVKMPTNVGISTFMRMINTTSERLKDRNFFICRYFSFYEHSVELSMKKVYNLWAWSRCYNTFFMLISIIHEITTAHKTLLLKNKDLCILPANKR